MTPEQIALIARATHHANRTYCRSIGDDSQPRWLDAPQWQQDSAFAGVAAVLDGTAKTPEEQHEVWAAGKSAGGWVYGPVKDADAKTHPCLVPYSDLPEEQRMKDDIFRATVKGVAAWLTTSGAV